MWQRSVFEIVIQPLRSGAEQVQFSRELQLRRHTLSHNGEFGSSQVELPGVVRRARTAI